MEKELYLNNLKEFLDKMGYGAETAVGIKDFANETIFEISVNDAKYLIGEKGSNLNSLEYLVKLICQSKNIDTKNLYLDVNDYRKERAKFLKEAARLAAQKVALTKKPVFLPPMPAFDRKVIHTELSINPNIATESEGFAEERRVVIKPFLN